MMTGKIKCLNADHGGFGLIAGEDGKEYYFHSNVLNRYSFYSLSVDREVSFDLENTVHGLRAIKVRVAYN